MNIRTRKVVAGLALSIAQLSSLSNIPAYAVDSGTPGDSHRSRPTPYDDGCAGYAGVIGTPAPQAPPQDQNRALGVMAYNIADGGDLWAVSHTINDVRPDIVLLNEVRCYYPSYGGRQDARWLAERSSSLPYFAFEDTVRTGVSGRKGVAILSKYPIISTSMHMVTYDGKATTYGTLEAIVRIGTKDHKAFSTRFTAHDADINNAHNKAGHQQAKELVLDTPLSVPVVFGGDFNTYTGGGWHLEFRDQARLTDVYLEAPDPYPCTTCHRIDILYYRGFYRTKTSYWRMGRPGASDHPYVLGFLDWTGVAPAATPAPASVSMPNPVPGGAYWSGKVTFASPAPAGGTAVKILSSNTSALGLSSNWITVPAGSNQASFFFTTADDLSSDTSVRVTASTSGGTASTTTIVEGNWCAEYFSCQ